MRANMETFIPFDGFYNSIHDAIIQNGCESCISDDYGNVHPIVAKEWVTLWEWRVVWDAYAKRFVEGFYDRTGIKVTFRELISPQYYNFTTDRILCDISEEEVTRIFNAVDREKLREAVKRRHSSYDGFISHYRSDLEEWPLDVLEWDCNQVETLIVTYLNTVYDDDPDEIDALEAEKISEDDIYQILNSSTTNDRIWRIVDYLRERANRTINQRINRG